MRHRTLTEGPASTVVLYGLPYTDWNAPLAAPALWEGIAGVSTVLRLPAVGVLLHLWPKARDAVVIPMKESHVLGVPRHVRSLVPRPETTRLLADKARFAEYMEAKRLGDYCPRTYRSAKDAEFPCILKRTDWASGAGVCLVSSAGELETRLKQPPFVNTECVLQEAVAGVVEYCTYCVCKDGRVLWSRTFVNEIPTPLTIRHEGNVLDRRSVETPPGILKQIEAVLAPLFYSGPCNIDYKLVAGGRMRIFEINPRLGGSLMLPRFRQDLQAALACIVKNATAAP